MERSLKLTAIGLTSLLSTLLSTLTLLSISPIKPAQANPVEAQQVTAWRSDLHRSYCAGNWTEAMSLAGAMMGSSEVRPHERLWLFLLRQDMFNFQRGFADFSGCQGGRVLAGITADAAQESSDRPSDHAAERSRSSVDWARGLVAIGADRPGQPTTTSPATTTSSVNQRTNNQSRTDRSAQTPTTTNCPPPFDGERRVADGSTSNQWNYEIWRNTSSQFYVRYWRQNQTCAQARTTSERYSTQNEAWQAFRQAIQFENN
jgi:hypothetical protein